MNRVFHPCNSTRLVFLMASTALSLVAQSSGLTTADLKGRVHLEGAAAGLAEASLVLINPETQERRTEKSDAQGEFRFWMLPPGTYSLEVIAKGYSTRRIREVALRVGSAVVLNLELKREAGTVVTVESEMNRVDPSRTQIASVIEPKLIDSLPIDRRNFVDFSLTVPGVAVSNTPTSPGVADSGLSFYGMHPRSNSFLVDGLDNNDLGTGAFGIPLSQEAIQEFQVVTGGFSAELGRATGGVVNSVTKSGTNQITGSLFTFYRPGQWDARSATGQDHSDYSQTQFGATVGGPIIKDRLFYFASVERYQKRDLNDVIIDPTALALIQANGFSVQDGAQSFKETQTSAMVKFDYAPNPENKWGLRLSMGQGTNENQIPWGGITARSAGGTLQQKGHSVALSHQWLGGAQWVNECRLMYARQESSLESMDPSQGVSVTIAGTATFGTERLTPQNTWTEHFQLQDTLTFTVGAHTLKTGVDILHSTNHGTVEQNTRGVYVFDALTALSPQLSSGLATFAAGIPAAYVQSWGNCSTRFKADSSALFLQDDWQLHPKFLLKLGIRYDREDLPTFEEASAYEALNQPPTGSDPYLGVLYGPWRLPDGAYSYSKLFTVQRDWSRSRIVPRLAFSWDVIDPLRMYGGYGVYSGSTQLGSLFGARIFNNQQAQTVFQTILDPGVIQTQSWPGAWSNSDRRLSAPPASYAPLLVIPGSYGMPESKIWNLGFEWTPASGHRLFLDIVQSRAHGFMNIRDVNAFVPYPNSLLNTIVPRRPDMRFSQVLRVDGSGESRYSGQTLGWEWRSSESWLLHASYTHGKAEDNYTDWTPDHPPQNTFDPSQEWGPSPEDLKDQWLFNAVYQSRSDRPLLKNWTISVIGRYTSGRPYSKLVGADQDMNGDGSADRPKDVGRNSERGPGTRTVDLRLARSVSIEKTHLQFIAEIFNLFNTRNVLQVQNVLNVTSPAYGTPLIYGAMRQFQFGAKIQF